MSPKEKKRKRKRKHKSRNKHEEIHELSYYLNDRLKLMKEVVHIMKPHKIKSMAPEFLKDVKFDDLMFLLTDELLGISKKRLKYIFSGKSDDIASSSCTDSEEEEEQQQRKKKQSDDVISLSDITSEEDDVILCNTKKVKDEVALNKRIKKEKGRKIQKTSKKPDSMNQTPDKEKLMSVLEILELQARARAIRSQLALESTANKSEENKDTQPETKDDSDPEAVVIQSPKKEEIVISSSSDSENEEAGSSKKQRTAENADISNPKSWEATPSSSLIQNSIICGNRKKQKIKIIRDRSVVAEINKETLNNNDESNSKEANSAIEEKEIEAIVAAIGEKNEENVAINEKKPNNTQVEESATITEATVEGNTEGDVIMCEEKEGGTSSDSREKNPTIVEVSVEENVNTNELKKGSDVSRKTVDRRPSCSDNEPDIIVINLDDSDDLQSDG